MLRSTTILLPGLLVLAACSGSSNPQKDAFVALNSREYSAAVGYFDQALEGLDETDNKYLDLVLGKCEALAATDADGAKALFLATTATHELVFRDYNVLVSRLATAKAFDQAIDILAHGKDAFPSEEAKLKQMAESIKTLIKGNPAALERLRGLGYL